MKFGVFFPNFGEYYDPRTLAELLARHTGAEIGLGSPCDGPMTARQTGRSTGRKARVKLIDNGLCRPVPRPFSIKARHLDVSSSIWEVSGHV